MACRVVVAYDCVDWSLGVDPLRAVSVDALSPLKGRVRSFFRGIEFGLRFIGLELISLLVWCLEHFARCGERALQGLWSMFHGKL